jgi:hypothetical protein
MRLWDVHLTKRAIHMARSERVNARIDEENEEVELFDA